MTAGLLTRDLKPVSLAPETDTTVLRCRELLEDLMPVIFGCGSRNAEYVRSEAEKNMLRRHKDLRYRGVGH